MKAVHHRRWKQEQNASDGRYDTDRALQLRLSMDVTDAKKELMMKERIGTKGVLFTLALSMLLGLTGCASPEAPAQASVVQSDLSRNTDTEVPEGSLDVLADGNTAFALDLYQQLQMQEGNLFFSPYSISLALAMTYAGARGATQEQMAQVMHYLLPQEELHPAYNRLEQVLASRSDVEVPEGGEPLRINIANAIWGQTGYTFLQSFLDTLALNYGAGLRLVDYITDAEGAREDINAWVSDETEGKIEDLIPPGALNSLTRLVLANAIYFNASWLFPFEEQATQEGEFSLLDGTQVSVPMMYQGEMFAYLERDGFQAIELPYIGNQTSMVIFLPDEGQFETFEEGFSPDHLSEWLEEMSTRNVMLAMPRFEYTSEMNLSQTLQAMGMERAFSDADFSGMDGTFELAISDVIHKAFVSVDEEGTEAAAATAVVMRATAIMEPGVELTIDRPFVYLIRDRETGTILFIGRVLNPEGE